MDFYGLINARSMVVHKNRLIVHCKNKIVILNIKKYTLVLLSEIEIDNLVCIAVDNETHTNVDTRFHTMQMKLVDSSTNILWAATNDSIKQINLGSYAFVSGDGGGVVTIVCRLWGGSRACSWTRVIICSGPWASIQGYWCRI